MQRLFQTRTTLAPRLTIHDGLQKEWIFCPWNNLDAAQFKWIKHIVRLPFCGAITSMICRVLNTEGIRQLYQSPRKIIEMLWPIKDNFSLIVLRIYSILYECGKHYMYQYIRTVAKCCVKHEHHLKYRYLEKSVLIEHSLLNGHKVLFEVMRILDHASNSHQGDDWNLTHQIYSQQCMEVCIGDEWLPEHLAVYHLLQEMSLQAMWDRVHSKIYEFIGRHLFMCGPVRRRHLVIKAKVFCLWQSVLPWWWRISSEDWDLAHIWHGKKTDKFFWNYKL